ncbi:hypothetical protein EGM51_00895 [Verrucomicrobia bacterium S94]|nr:hypothetical protein EGM51_00895 [Verrucomicrobia bacterium S94]
MPDPVWSFIESLPGYSAPQAEWNQGLDEWPQLPHFKKHFLQLTKEHADSIRCLTKCAFSCPRRIVRHSDDDIAAICDEGEPEFQVSRSDLLIYKLKQTILNKALCASLDISFKESAIDGLCNTWRIGEFIPTEGFRFPVFVTMQKTESALQDVCRQLCHTHEDSFALIIPSRCGLTPSIEELLAQKKCALGVFAEDFNINKSALTVNRTPEIIFKPLLDQVPEADSGGTVFFQTPKGTTWEDIKIQFRDNHTVSIWAGEKTGMYTYSDMGMSNQRNKKPTKQWVAFLAFAATEGAIDWNSELAATNLKSQKAALSKRLRAFFHLEDDPIYWDDSSGSYRCRFTILSEGTDDSW